MNIFGCYATRDAPQGNSYHATELRRPRRRPRAPLDAAYHQQITNAFRDEFPYGTGTIPSPDRLQEGMDKVYSQFPLPPGPIR